MIELLVHNAQEILYLTFVILRVQFIPLYKFFQRK